MNGNGRDRIDSHLRDRVAAARVGRLATVRPDGAPHVVVVTFALVDDRIVTAVDHKPKSTRRLQRLTNIRHEPRVSVLVDHYEEDWTKLWWARADGRAEIRDATAARAALDALADKYVRYRDHRPEGPVIVIDVDRWTGWSAQA